MLGGAARGLGAVVLLAVTACSPGAPAPAPPAAPLRLSAELTQDSRDAARDQIAVVLANDGAVEVTPEAIEYADPRLSGTLTADRLRAIPPGGERRFPLPLLDPVCGAPAADEGRLDVRVGPDSVTVRVGDDAGVVARWVERRCAELDVAAVAPLAFSAVRVHPDGGSADLVLTARPTGEGRIRHRESRRDTGVHLDGRAVGAERQRDERGRPGRRGPARPPGPLRRARVR